VPVVVRNGELVIEALVAARERATTDDDEHYVYAIAL
jgi:hypothetical protein